MQDEMSVFLVEGVLFRVHRYFLQRDSDVFRTMFVCPPTEEGPEGRTDERPIVLPEVTAVEFETLLKFFYNSMYSKPLESVEEWVALLSISTRYGMDRVRERALEEIDSMPPVDPIRRIVLAKKHDVAEWLVPAYAALCRRVEPLNVLEAVEIGLETTVLVATAREKVRERDIINIIAGHPSSEELDDPFVLGVIDEVFGLHVDA
ncbi:hypothetical protein BV22DRAFT_1005071 [Leucogyrophana mollusca]|uniref:Uncharacterized protein n=1 Tax=Leucogyrophana mollusca TaxID=85980 RepID=A0ACB8BSI5_9AGAM|nr:hypothetical protein BV22DRAFT_1005071 [Leucogyrophana mollusca]